MIFPRRQFILLAVLASGATLHGQAPVTISPANLSQIMAAQPPVELDTNITTSAVFDPPVAVPGEKVFYRVMIDAPESSIRWPETLPLPVGLQIIGGTRGQITQNLPGKFRSLTSFIFELRATNTGHFTIPAFPVEILGQAFKIPAAAFDCATQKPASIPPARQLTLEVSKTNVFLGEPFKVRVLLPARPDDSIEAVREIQFNGEGFVSDKSSMRQVVEMVVNDEKKVPAYVYEQTVTPIGPGERTLSVQGFAAGRDFNGSISIRGRVVIPGGPPSYVLLMSDPVKITVRPLPVAGSLPGFTGGMGRFTCGPPQLSTNRLRVGLPVELKVVVHGPGGLNRLNPPPPPRVNDWQIIPAQNGGIVYTLIPLTDEVKATPAIPFSCFDPASGKYINLTIPSVPVTVLGEGLPLNLAVSDENTPGTAVPQLSGLAATPGTAAASLKPLQLRGWFVLLQLLPVLLFVDLWQWARHRKYLEAHPEIVRQRQARRALRRENRRRKRAVATGDSAGFLRHAVAALRAVCAPHYPANPQALVCADVLAVLSGTERDEREGATVRQIFSAADAAFSAQPARPSDWLALEADLAAVLQKLEARL